MLTEWRAENLPSCRRISLPVARERDPFPTEVEKRVHMRERTISPTLMRISTPRAGYVNLADESSRNS